MAVDPLGSPLVVDNTKRLYKLVLGKWRFIGNSVVEVSVGAEGSVYVLGGPKDTNSDYKIKKWDAERQGWIKVDGRARKIAVDWKGRPWVI